MRQGLYKYEMCVSYRESQSERAERQARGQKGVDPPAEGWGGKLLIWLWWAQVYGDRIDIDGG